MKKFRRSFGVLLIITALIVMQLPVGTAEAADSAVFYTEGATLVAYRGNDKSVSVPNNITVIGSSAFEDNQSMEKVSFPKSLRRIKPYAFWGCDSLGEISFGSGLKEIGDYAFTSCKGMTSLTIPSNITSIGIRSFADCTNLLTVTIPETVTYIHETAFDGCTNLVINCQEGSYADKYARDFYKRQALMEEYEDVDSNEGASGTDGKQNTFDDQNTDNPTSTGNEDEGNILGTTSVVGNQAVFLLDSREATVYQGYISMEDEVSVSYPVKYRIVNDNVIADQAYYKDEALQEIIIPEGISEIGELAFARSKATALYVPNGALKICYAAFYHCDGLSNVVLPDSVRKVEPKAFKYTAWTENFLKTGAGGNGDFLISGGVLVQYRGTDTEIVIPDGVRVIAAECFQGADTLEKVTFPESLTDIGEAAFEGCGKLSEIIWKNGLLTIGDRAFSGCALTEVTIPGTLQSLGLGAFDDDVSREYLGKQPARTHETSAERLSNEAYRRIETAEDSSVQGGSVLVLGMTGARARLDKAERPYTLRLSLSQDGTELRQARESIARNIGKNAGSELYVLHCTFSDDSGIPITKLGKNALVMELPVPEELKNQEILVYQYDRNGQASPLTVRYIRNEEQLYLQIETNQTFDMILEGTGQNLSSDSVEDSQLITDHTVLQERTESLQVQNGEEKEDVSKWMILKWSAGALLLLFGLFFALSKVK